MKSIFSKIAEHFYIFQPTSNYAELYCCDADNRWRLLETYTHKNKSNIPININELIKIKLKEIEKTSIDYLIKKYFINEIQNCSTEVINFIEIMISTNTEFVINNIIPLIRNSPDYPFDLKQNEYCGTEIINVAFSKKTAKFIPQTYDMYLTSSIGIKINSANINTDLKKYKSTMNKLLTTSNYERLKTWFSDMLICDPLNHPTIPLEKNIIIVYEMPMILNNIITTALKEYIKLIDLNSLKNKNNIKHIEKHVNSCYIYSLNLETDNILEDFNFTDIKVPLLIKIINRNEDDKLKKKIESHAEIITFRDNLGTVPINIENLSNMFVYDIFKINV